MNATEITRGIGLVELPQGRNFQFRFGHKVEPEVLDRFEAGERVEDLLDRRVRAFVSAFQRINQAEGLEPQDRRFGIEGALKSYLGKTWEVGNTGITEDNFSHFSAFLQVDDQTRQTFLIMPNQDDLSLSTRVAVEGGHLAHQISASLALAPQSNSAEFFPHAKA